jgi:hypothetical protein
MYSLMTPEAAVLSLVVLGVTLGLMLAVPVLWRRSPRRVLGLVTCPLLAGRVTAELVRDDWTLRFTDVTRCSVLGADVRFCRKACLTDGAVDWPVSRGRPDLDRPARSRPSRARG